MSSEHLYYPTVGQSHLATQYTVGYWLFTLVIMWTTGSCNLLPLLSILWVLDAFHWMLLICTSIKSNIVNKTILSMERTVLALIHGLPCRKCMTFSTVSPLPSPSEPRMAISLELMLHKGLSKLFFLVSKQWKISIQSRYIQIRMFLSPADTHWQNQLLEDSFYSAVFLTLWTLIVLRNIFYIILLFTFTAVYSLCREKRANQQ